jgi:dodecin
MAAASTVAKVIEVTSSSKKGIEDAVQTGLKKVGKSVKNIKGAWVNDIKVVTNSTGAVTEWRVSMRVSFVVD